MSGKESEAVTEGNGPNPVLGGIALVELRQAVSETWGEALKEIKENLASMRTGTPQKTCNSSIKKNILYLPQPSRGPTHLGRKTKFWAQNTDKTVTRL